MAPPKRPWFRLYTEMVWDLKIRGLTIPARWLWIAMLSLARSSPIPGFLMVDVKSPVDQTALADAAAMKTKDVAKGLDELDSVGLIEWDNNLGTWSIPKWNERQYESDDTAKRTAKHRRKNVLTPDDVTPPETEAYPEADSETDSNRNRVTSPEPWLRARRKATQDEAFARCEHGRPTVADCSDFECRRATDRVIQRYLAEVPA